MQKQNKFNVIIEVSVKTKPETLKKKKRINMIKQNKYW